MGGFDHLEFNTTPTEALYTPTPKAHSEQARALRRAGYFEKALPVYRQAIGMNDHNYDAWTEYIDTLVRANHLDEADTFSKTALSNYRRVHQFYAARALVLSYQGDFNAAQTHVQTAMNQTAAYPYCVYAEILLRESLSFRSEALDALQTALNTSEERWEPCFLGGCILLNAKLPALAAGYFSEAVHVAPHAAAGLLFLGDSFAALRLYDQAQFYYQKVVELEPDHAVALERQRSTVPLLYGLTRVFRRENLRTRWNKEFEKR